ncbi:hypothetical protein COCVIDRAFT_29841 [Bipolaris victoriae FI3]|uniref:Transcription factor domain-containing protein n=1 Tax=Bipolaris victoriae (strain FI3) TaxID=930091 RepID=W7EGD9_BIPV3|nr:hypothetical protein COCVIDRAFT_29841 [Bipolaris victoriae FI3]
MDLDRNLAYFFHSFLPMNVLTKNNASWQSELQLFLHQSPALSSAVSAIAALHRFQQERLLLNTTGVGKGQVQALNSYSQAVKHVRTAITSNSFAGPALLWSTFFLALFELMRDSSGTDWLSHFLNGTCAILRLQHPAYLLLTNADASHRRNFFFTTRIFEIARALIYSQPTFLSEPEWANALSQWWSCEEGQRLWHPKEALFDMLPHFCDLSLRTLRFAQTEETYLQSSLHHPQAQMLADEGIELQQGLQQWWICAEAWGKDTSEVDADLVVARTYYHAMSIYLSGSYDYHKHWNQPGSPPAPILNRSSIEMHMNEILRLGQELLDHGLAGLLLFIPLRIAGARVSYKKDQDLILRLLKTISQRGYAVANAIYIDLVELWARKMSTN